MFIWQFRTDLIHQIKNVKHYEKLVLATSIKKTIPEIYVAYKLRRQTYNFNQWKEFQR